MSRSVDRVVVFDLDDTLYLERDYVRSGFAAAGRWLAKHHGIAGLADAAWAAFVEGHRGHIFDIALTALGPGPRADLVPELVEAYRRHWPSIALAPDAAAWLSRTAGRTALALVTDGPATSQSNKVAALGLAARGFAPIILTARIGHNCGKPHPRGFQLVSRAFGLPPGRFTYVADNPAKDFLAPRRMGWKTVQIARNERLHRADAPSVAHSADSVIDSLDAFD